MYLEVTSTYHTKVDVPNSVTCLIRTSIFECYVVWYGFKSGYRKDLYMRKIGPLLKKMITILGSIVNIIGRTCMTI
jgi:hypothetical protein